MLETEIAVSVVMISYNHENYIKEAIEGVLMQECDFNVELIIADDNSPDNTEAVVLDLIKNHKNGHWIKYVKHSTNKGMMPNFLWALNACKGKYIALCEGDDYWIDSQKLQKQVSFLEKNKDYNLSVSGYTKYNTYTKKYESIIDSPSGLETSPEGFSFSLEDSRKRWLTKTLTALFRNDVQVTQQLAEYKYGRDVHLFYHILKSGKGFYFTKEMGVYRVHLGGVVSMKSTAFHYKTGYLIYKELYGKNNDEYSRKEFLRSTLSLLNIKIYSSSEEFKDIKYRTIFKELRSTTKKFGDIGLYLRNIFPYRVKNYIQKKFYKKH